MMSCSLTPQRRPPHPSARPEGDRVRPSTTFYRKLFRSHWPRLLSACGRVEGGGAAADALAQAADERAGRCRRRVTASSSMSATPGTPARFSRRCPHTAARPAAGECTTTRRRRLCRPACRWQVMRRTPAWPTIRTSAGRCCRRAGTLHLASLAMIDPAVFRSDATLRRHRYPQARRRWRRWGWIGSGSCRWRRAVAEVRRCDGLSQQRMRSPSLDLNTLRIHYQRSDANFAPWGCTCGTPRRIDAAPWAARSASWDNQVTLPLAIARLPGALGQRGRLRSAGWRLRTMPRAAAIQFIVHGTPDNRTAAAATRTAGRTTSASITPTSRRSVASAEIWLVQDSRGVLRAPTIAPGLDRRCARLLKLDDRLLQWPKAERQRRRSNSTTRRAARSSPRSTLAVSGADGTIDLEVFTGGVPAELAARFGTSRPAWCCRPRGATAERRWRGC